MSERAKQAAKIRDERRRPARDVAPQKPRKKSHKPFIIEWKYTDEEIKKDDKILKEELQKNPNANPWILYYHGRKWTKLTKYERLIDALKALIALRKNTTQGLGGAREFRIVRKDKNENVVIES